MPALAPTFQFDYTKEKPSKYNGNFGVFVFSFFGHVKERFHSKIKNNSEVHLEVPALAPTFQFKYTKENSQNTKEILNDFDFLFLA